MVIRPCSSRGLLWLANYRSYEELFYPVINFTVTLAMMRLALSVGNEVKPKLD